MAKKHIMDYMQKAQTTRCEYCGTEKDGLSFFIGANTKPDWTLCEGTGKMTCPDCYPIAMAEGQKKIRGGLNA